MVSLHLKRAPTHQRIVPYALEAYEGIRQEGVDPQASTGLPSLDFSRLLDGLKQLRAGHAAGGEQLGEYLAEWLWRSQEDTKATISHDPTPWTFNPVGDYLRKVQSTQTTKEPLKVWLSIDETLQGSMEFRDFLPFECLPHNQHLPVRIIRGGNTTRTSPTNKATASPTITVSDMLRVLLVYANPDADQASPGSTYPHAPDLQKSFHHVLQTLFPLVNQGEIYIEQRENPTPKDLQEALRSFNPHIFLFLGHGFGTGDGGLVCIDHGAPVPLPIAQLIGTLKHIPNAALRLTVLMACQSFGAASRFLDVGVPACVAMQPLVRLNFPAESAPVFAGPFFQQLVQFAPITQAYNAGVATLENSSIPLAAWMPTLWLASPSDQLFEEKETRFQQHYVDALLGKPEVGLIPVVGQERGVPFKEIYIPQQLQGHKKETATGKTLKTQTLWEPLHQHPRLQVVAPTWMGKRTLCQWAAHECMAQLGVVPIYVRRQDWRNPEQTFVEFLKQGYTNWLGWGTRRIRINQPEGPIKSRGLGTWLFEKWQNGQALVILEPRPKIDMTSLLHHLAQEFPSDCKWSQNPRVLWCTEQFITSPAMPECGHMTLAEWIPSQHEQLLQKVVLALGQPHKAAPLRQDLTTDGSEKQTKTLTRPGYLMIQAVTYITDSVLLKEEGELLHRVVTHRLAITGRTKTLLEPDEPVYKGQILEYVAMHSWWCQQGEADLQDDFLAVISQALQGLKMGEIPIYDQTAAPQILEDLRQNSEFLKADEQQNVVIEPGPWTKYFVASFITRKLFQRDKEMVQWVNQNEERTMHGSMECRVCSQPLPPFSSVMTKENMGNLQEALKCIEEEEAPAYARVDPWDPKFKSTRQLLNVLATLLHPPQVENA